MNKNQLIEEARKEIIDILGYSNVLERRQLRDEKWVDEVLTTLLTKHEDAVLEKGRLSVLQDFDSLMKADAFMGLTDDEWKAVRKFFRYSDEISGWKEATTDHLKSPKSE